MINKSDTKIFESGSRNNEQFNNGEFRKGVKLERRPFEYKMKTWN